MADPSPIFKWLVAYSSLLGSIGGVLICDYFFVRRCELSLPDLYAKDGKYWYSGGFNPKALAALVGGILPLVPGFLGTVGVVEVPQFWTTIYHYAWFISFGVSFTLYAILTGREK